MASIAIMIGGAVLNAAAFTGGNYLAKYIAGDDGKAALAEKTRHDKALEAYQAAMEKYTCERTQLLDWIESNREIKDQANPDYKLTQPTEQKFSDMYQPSELQKQGELLFVGARIRSFSFSLNFFALLINGFQTPQNLLQPPGLLERLICHKKISRSRDSAWR